jgi:hypothetical protein
MVRDKGSTDPWENVPERSMIELWARDLSAVKKAGDREKWSMAGVVVIVLSDDPEGFQAVLRRVACDAGFDLWLHSGQGASLIALKSLAPALVLLKPGLWHRDPKDIELCHGPDPEEVIDFRNLLMIFVILILFISDLHWIQKL